MEDMYMPEEKEQKSLWEQTGNKCLERALELLNEETALGISEAGAVNELISAAVSIDILNLRWAEQNRYGGAVFRGQALEQTTK